MGPKDGKVIVHAPNVHCGGGLVLLRSLLAASHSSVKWIQLDRRIDPQLSSTIHVDAHYVDPRLVSRFKAEWRLWKKAEKGDIVLCFHGLPPVWSLRAQVVVFLQNRLLVTQNIPKGYPIKTYIRLLVERMMLRFLSSNIDKVIVQTPSMARDVRRVLGSAIDIVVTPFAPILEQRPVFDKRKFDFVYVAGDEAHKNHSVLLEAWRLLAESGVKPSLAITVPVNSSLARAVTKKSALSHLNITNLGHLQFRQIVELYGSSSALIYPSTVESFGLPLVEASQYGLAILAPEMDYVRDVVEPVQTFDPRSPVSIARAVKRYLDVSDPPLTIKTSREFLAEVVK